MTRTTLLLLLARLRSHPGRSLVLVGVVAVASGIAMSALAVLAVADDPWAPLVEATNGGHVEIDELDGRSPDPEALVAIPGVDSVGTLVESGDAALQVGGDVMVVSLRRMPDREAMVVDRPLMMSGRWFRPGDEGEVVFEATLADTLGLDVGDEVALTGEGSRRTVEVVGTAATTMMPNYPERVPGSVFAGDTLFDAVDPAGPPRWSVGLRLLDPSQADSVAASIEGARTAADISANAFPARADEFATIMLFFAVLMLVAAVMLVVTLLGSRLVSEARELTLLQVAGVTPGRLALLVATEHALLAVVGVLAGTVVAHLVAPRITESAATVLGTVSPNLTAPDIVRVGVVAVACTAVVSAVGGFRAGRRSLAIVVRGGSGRVHRSRIAAVALVAWSRATPVLGLKDIATRRGRTAVTVLSVALAVTMAVAVVGLGSTELVDPAAAPALTTDELPADPADIRDLPVWPSAVDDAITDRILALITTLEVLLGAVAIVTLLAAAAMTLQERLRELGTLHALGCTTPQLVGASAMSQGVLGVVGTVIGVPLGMGLYLLLTSASGGGLEGGPAPAAVGLVAVAAVAICAVTAAVPALVVQRRPTNQALAAE